MQKIKHTILILLTLQLMHGQGGFKRQFKVPGAFQNTAFTVFEATNGNYITAGLVVDTINGYLTNRLTLVGLNNQGQVQWTKKYGNDKFEYLENVLITKYFYKQGNFIYHTGCVRDSNNIYLGVLLKFNLNGDTVWQKKFYGPSGIDIIPQQITGSVDNGFFICGIIQDHTANVAPVLLIKTDAYGNELWRKILNKNIPNVHDAKAICQDSVSKKIVTVGYQYIGNSSSWLDYMSVLIMDSMGNKLNQLNYSGKQGILMDLIQTKDKKFVAIGALRQAQTFGGLKSYKNYAVKFDINNPGTPIWGYEYGVTAAITRFNSMFELPSEDLILGGSIDTLQQNNLNRNVHINLTRITKGGVEIWNKLYNYQDNAPADYTIELFNIKPTSDGGMIAAIKMVNTSPDPFFIVKYDSTGCDSSMAYCSSVGLNELNTIGLKGQFSIYPNPTSGVFHISPNELSNPEVQSLKLFDILGQTVYFTKNKNEIDVSFLKPGVYFLQLFKQNKLVQTIKLIKE